MKTCRKCGKTMSIDEFHIDRKNNDGHNCKCKDCVHLDQKVYRGVHGKKGTITGIRPYHDDIRGPHASKIRQIDKTAQKLIRYGAVSRTFASVGAVYGSWK